MERKEVGMLARSTAGHDKGCLYVIIDVDDAYVYLADGIKRKLSSPKKKKKKHVQMIGERQELLGLDDVKLKRILKLFDKKTEE